MSYAQLHFTLHSCAGQSRASGMALLWADLLAVATLLKCQPTCALPLIMALENIWASTIIRV